MTGLSARAKVEALANELGESFDEAVGSLLDMGEITQAQADRLLGGESATPLDQAVASYRRMSDAELAAVQLDLIPPSWGRLVKAERRRRREAK